MSRRGLVASLRAAAAAILGIWGAISLAPAEPAASDIGGQRPSYGPATPDDVSNRTAIVRRIWLPELDRGYDPQGLTIADGAVIVSGYRSERLEQRRGPCFAVQLDLRNGRKTGHVDLPPPCGHAGGAATAADGMLYVADTHTLFAAPLAEAFSGEAPLFRRVLLGPGLVGALAVSEPDAIWLGTYREDGPGRLYRFDRATLAALRDGDVLGVRHSSAQLAIPSYAQGAAFDRAGRLWVARSDTRWGELAVVDPRTGNVERRFATAPGIEGIAFDAEGRLWAVSEAGARHSYDHWWSPWVLPFFPLVFALDPQRLE
jgi:hypothetical protein